MDDKIEIKLWLASLVIFALVVIVSVSITSGDVTLGISEHQAATSADRVDEIQTQWRDGGVRGLAIFAIICDLAWIWIYALASFQVGKGFATRRQGFLRTVGLVICMSAVVFALTDYTETILQLIQLLRDVGSDQMAQVASTVQPIKIYSFLVAFILVTAALVIDRFSRRANRA